MKSTLKSTVALLVFFAGFSLSAYDLETPAREIVHVFAIGSQNEQLGVQSPSETDFYYPNQLIVLADGRYIVSDMGNIRVKMYAKDFVFLDSARVNIRDMQIQGNTMVFFYFFPWYYSSLESTKFSRLIELPDTSVRHFSVSLFDRNYLFTPTETGFAWKIEKSKLVQLPEDEWLSKSNYRRTSQSSLNNSYIGEIDTTLGGLYDANEFGLINFASDKATHPSRINIAPASLKGIDQKGNQYFAYVDVGIENYFAIANAKQGLIKAFDITPTTHETYNSSPFIATNGDIYYLVTNKSASTLYRIKNTWDPITMATLNDSQVRVRDAGSTNGKTLATLNKGDKVAILETSKDKQTIGGRTAPWYKVQLSDWSTGWVFGAFVDIDAVK